MFSNGSLCMRQVLGLAMLMSIVAAASAVADEPAERLDHLQRALAAHQRMYDYAVARGLTPSPARQAAWEAFGPAVEAAGTDPAQLDAAEAALRAVEATLPDESRRLLFLNRIAEWTAAAPLFRDHEKESQFVDRMAEFVRGVSDPRTELTGIEEEADQLWGEAGLFDLPYQPGLGVNGFGRFGWQNSSGTLCDNVAFESIKTTTQEQQLGRISAGDLEMTSAGAVLSFAETAIRLAFAPAVAGNVADHGRGPNWIGTQAGNVHMTLQRPSTRFDASEANFAFQLDGTAFDRSFIGFVSSNGWRSARLDQAAGQSIDLSDMAQPWVLLDLADAKENQRILLVVQFQHRLRDLRIDADSLTFNAVHRIGSVWTFRPWGVHRHPVPDDPSEKITPDLLRQVEGLCGLNLAWPVDCREYFRVDRESDSVVIRNDVQFEERHDDWSTKPVASAAVPPMLVLAMSYRAPVTLSFPVTDWKLPTKYGPFVTALGGSFEYTLPLPPLYRHGLLRDESQTELRKQINQWAYYQGTPQRGLADTCYVGVTSLLQARPYVNESRGLEIIETAEGLIEAKLEPETFWRFARWRAEPFTNLRYCYEYPGGHYGTGTVADITWGNALVFYGYDVWAATTGNWKAVEAAWPQLWALTEYLTVSHDWAWMADSINEQGEGAAIDCLTAVHAGLIALARMARTLDQGWRADRVLYLAAKTAVPHAARFAYLDYVQRHDLWHSDSPNRGTINGFHERDCWIHPVHVGPWWGVCSLSGHGVEPECFDAAFAYVGDQPIREWWRMVESIYPNWFDGSHRYNTDVIYNGNSGHITMPALYLQLRMGVETPQLLEWLARGKGNHEGYWQAPIVLAAIASRDCPLEVTDWGRLIPRDAAWDGEKKRATLAFHNPDLVPETVTLMVRRQPAKILMDSKPVESRTSTDRWGTPLLSVNVSSGDHALEFLFDEAKGE